MNNESKSPTIVTYVGQDEILVCLQNIEKEFLEEFFCEGSGRDLNEYSRVAHVELYAGFSLSTKAIRIS